MPSGAALAAEGGRGINARAMETRSIYTEGTLEIRRGGAFSQLFGSFPYRSLAVVRDRGRVRKETFEAGAFSFALADETRAIDLLYGHSFDRPLASRKAGSLVLEDTADALTFRATLPAEGKRPSWMRDAVLAVEAGLVAGISPGFRIPPKSAVPDAEELIPEPGNEDVMIRRIRAAVLREISLVTAPAYPETGLDLRDEGETVDLRNRRLWTWL